MIYIASPYSSPLPEMVKHRFHEAERFTAHCIREGLAVFSPIVYCHLMAQKYTFGTDAAFWTKFNMQFLRHAEAIFLLELPGWDQSAGVKIELNVAKILDIPIIPYDTGFNPRVTH